MYSMSGDASGKPTPSYKEILRSKDKAVSEAQQSIERSGREHLIKGKEKNQSIKKATTKNVYRATMQGEEGEP